MERREASWKKSLRICEIAWRFLFRSCQFLGFYGFARWTPSRHQLVWCKCTPPPRARTSRLCPRTPCRPRRRLARRSPRARPAPRRARQREERVPPPPVSISIRPSFRSTPLSRTPTRSASSPPRSTPKSTTNTLLSHFRKRFSCRGAISARTLRARPPRPTLVLRGETLPLRPSQSNSPSPGFVARSRPQGVPEFLESATRRCTLSSVATS